MGTVNTRTHRAYHGGAESSTANINGVAAGGLMSAALQFGYEDIITAPADGLSFPVVDRLTQFVRGNITCQDWIKVIDVLNGSRVEPNNTYVFYELESGVATCSKYTLLNPTIHAASFSLTHRGYGTVNWDFECMAADENDGLTDLFAVENGATLPAAALTTARSLEITAAQHATGPTDIYHITNLSFNVAGTLVKASQDGDVGYTAVDVVWGGIPMGGSITFQDSTNSNVVKAITLLGLAEGDLTVTVKQSQGASDKTLVLKNLVFTKGNANYDNSGNYTGYTLNFILNGDETTPIGTANNKPFAGDTAGITIT